MNNFIWCVPGKVGRKTCIVHEKMMQMQQLGIDTVKMIV